MEISTNSSGFLALHSQSFFMALFQILPLLWSLLQLNILIRTCKKLPNLLQNLSSKIKFMAKFKLQWLQLQLWLWPNYSLIINPSKLSFSSYIFAIYIRIITTFINNMRTILRQPRPLALIESLLLYYFYMGGYHNSGYSINVRCQPLSLIYQHERSSKVSCRRTLEIFEFS